MQLLNKFGGLITVVLSGVVAVFLTFSPVAHRIGWGQLITPILMTIIYSLVIWFLYWIVPLTKKIAGPLGAVTIIATMTWMDYPSAIFPVGIILLTLMLLTRLSKTRRKTATGLVTTAIPISLCILVIWAGIWSAVSAVSSSNNDVGTVLETNYRGDLPNVYFIVPDRLTSVTGLKKMGADAAVVDNYANEMRELGFYVRETQLSIDEVTPDSAPVPTTRTFRFMSSILNDGIDIPLAINYNTASRLINRAAVFDDLHGIGYEIHNIGSWYTETQTMPKADFNYIYDHYGIMGMLYRNELGMAVIDRSILRYLNVSPVLPNKQHIEIRRAEHAFQKKTVEEIAASAPENTDDAPVFVMAHMMLPHVPYVWGKDGGYPDTSLGAVGLYIEQAQFTLWFIQDMAERILDSDPEAIILVQSDEGCLFSDAVLNKGVSEDVWNGQMISWRIPGAGIDELDNVEPVQLLGWVVDWTDGDAD